MNDHGNDAPEHGPLFLIDGNNLAYRAFFALPETISTSAGFPTNALYGFCSMMIKVLAEFAPEVVIVAWDSREKTFRHEDFEEYKAHRKPMPDLLREQWPHLRELSEAFGFVNLNVPGYEGDDILGTLARQGDAEGRQVVIVTGDRDALQLVTANVTVMSNTRGITDVKLYDPHAVEERFGVPPSLIPDLIGLKGDSSDNIPGVPGIGEKTAALLLQEYGSLEEVLAHAGEVKAPKRRELLLKHADDARMSKELARLDREVPIDIHAAEVAPHHLDRARLAELLHRFEFSSLLDRLGSEPLARVVDIPAPARAHGPGLRIEQVGLRELARELAVPGRIGLAGARQDGLSRLWLARRGAADGTVPAGPSVDPAPPADAGATPLADATPPADATAFALDFSETESDALRALLARSEPACHDFKSDPLLPGLLRSVSHDTMVAAYLLAPGRRSYELSDLAVQAGVSWLDVEETSGLDGPDGHATRALAALDVSRFQERALRETGMWDLFRDVELPLSRALLDMEAVGIHLDCYRLGEITAKVEDQLDGLEAQAYEAAGEEFNLGSPQQLAGVLFEKLGLPRQRKTKTGYSTDAHTLDALRDLHPVIELIETHRELTKLLSTYLLALPSAVDPATGRLHTTFHQAVAATGRLSSSDPNLQNIPVRTDLGARIRGCFTAEEGRVLVVADYSQIELRIMAHLSGEPTLLDAFRRGEDIHTRTAAEVFDLPEEEVDATHRRYAKAVNFGIMYGISAFGLARQLKIPQNVAGEYIERYSARMPHVRAFIEATISDASAQGFVATIMGRRRPIPELRSGNQQTRQLGERLAVNSVIQGSAADIIKVAMLRCRDRLARESRETRLVLQVHDELIFECPLAAGRSVARMVREEMVGSWVVDPPLIVDVGVGEDWLSAK
ncbi:MAG TPA: DNA polymerase I [Thermoleophilia bacterium]|nr:DNA polymerase I [Thermoleophilia bacterium]